MKKIIGIIFISLMFCTIGFAKIRQIENHTLGAGKVVTTVCIDNFKFVIAQDSNTGGISIVQAFTSVDQYGTLPKSCYYWK